MTQQILDAESDIGDTEDVTVVAQDTTAAGERIETVEDQTPPSAVSPTPDKHLLLVAQYHARGHSAETIARVVGIDAAEVERLVAEHNLQRDDGAQIEGDSADSWKPIGPSDPELLYKASRKRVIQEIRAAIFGGAAPEAVRLAFDGQQPPDVLDEVIQRAHDDLFTKRQRERNREMAAEAAAVPEPVPEPPVPSVHEDPRTAHIRERQEALKAREPEMQERIEASRKASGLLEEQAENERKLREFMAKRQELKPSSPFPPKVRVTKRERRFSDLDEPPRRRRNGYGD